MDMIDFLISMLVVLLVLGVFYYAIHRIVILPPPVLAIADVVLLVVFLIWVLYNLGGISGHPIHLSALTALKPIS